jgi:quercetin dioxygenase-like cupin family protein
MRSAGRPIRWLVILGTLLGGIALGTTGHHLLAAPPSFSETPLFRADLAGIDEYELIVSRLETTSGWSHGRHYHAGHEIVYVLEGEGALDVEGRPPQRLQPGTVAYVPPRQIHAGRNASRTAAFKFLLIRLHVKGEPMSVELK